MTDAKKCPKCGKPKCDSAVWGAACTDACHGDDCMVSVYHPTIDAQPVASDLTALIELLAHETGYDDELFKIDAIQRDEIVLALRLLRVLRHPVKPMAWVHEGHVMLDVMDEINDVTLDEAERALVIGGNHDD